MRGGLVVAALITAALPVVAGAQPPAEPGEPAVWISDGGENLSVAPDLSDDGSQVVFQSLADLTGSATTTTPQPTPTPDPEPTETPAPTETPQTTESPEPTETALPPMPLRAQTLENSGESRPWRVYVRDRDRDELTLLSDPGLGHATAPSISGSGRLVAWVQRSGTQADIMVADRDPDADGVFDEPGQRTVRRVTDTTSDLRFQRTSGCSPGAGPVQCGPQLSADGSSLAFPAWLGPTSASLVPMIRFLNYDVLPEVPIDPQRAPGDVIDFGRSVRVGFDERIEVTLLARGPRAMQLRGVTIEGGEGTFRIDEQSCTATVMPGEGCTVQIVFEPTADSCPADGGWHVHRAQLVTDATTAAGRAAYPIVAGCWGGFQYYYDSPTAPRQAPATSCPAPDLSGLRPRPIEDVHTRGFGHQVADAGSVQLGRADLVALEVGPVEGSRVSFDAPAGCAVQLVTPPPQQRLPGRAEPCREGSETLLSSCTAYVLLRPTALRAVVGSLDLAGTVTRFVADGVRSVVIARRDASGEGDFAGEGAPPPAVVSVDGAGNPVHGIEPSISGTGRFVAFTSTVSGLPQVYVHDTDARGDRSYRPGPTQLASISSPPPPPGVPAGERPPPPPPRPAGAPSLSADGNRVAYSSDYDVYLRDLAAAVTVPVSEGFTRGHALSGDGTTVAFSTSPGESDADPGGLRVRFLPDLAGGGITETLVPDAPAAGHPALDRHGRHVGFDTYVPLASADGNGTGDVYLAERLPAVTLEPGTLDFGPVPLDTTGGPLQVTVSNAGPGPLVITGTPLTGPFTPGDSNCGPAVHAGQTCTLGVVFAPTVRGPGNGTLTVSDLDADYTASLIGSGTVGGTGPTVVDTDRDGFAAELVLSPTVAEPGGAVLARGTEFPPNAEVVLTWRPGLGRTPVTTDPAGAFTVSVPIFPNDQLGDRVMIGTAGDVAVQSDPMLVVPPTGQPPGFYDRG